jgi:hypothetical protein
MREACGARPGFSSEFSDELVVGGLGELQCFVAPSPGPLRYHTGCATTGSADKNAYICVRCLSEVDRLDAGATAMNGFDYSVPAELFAAGSVSSRNLRIGYRRFSQAAEAIRYAVEQLGPGLLRGSCMEVNETRYSGAEIEMLYRSEAYPLRRNAPVG